MLFHSRRHGENVGVEDDVFRRKADLVDENLVGTLADADLVFVGGGLALLVEGHDHSRRSILENSRGILTELRFALFERDRVNDSLALQALEACLDDLPLRGVHHKRNLCDLGLTGQQLQVARHSCDAVDHALVHADIDHVGTIVDLLPGHTDRFFVLAFLD